MCTSVLYGNRSGTSRQYKHWVEWKIGLLTVNECTYTNTVPNSSEHISQRPAGNAGSSAAGLQAGPAGSPAAASARPVSESGCPELEAVLAGLSGPTPMHYVYFGGRSVARLQRFGNSFSMKCYVHGCTKAISWQQFSAEGEAAGMDLAMRWVARGIVIGAGSGLKAQHLEAWALPPPPQPPAATRRETRKRQ